MQLSVYNIEGKDTGKKVTLSDDVFSIEPNEHTVYLDVKQYLANQRQGTHKTKERWEVNYSTRKMLKQKGTGGARHGSRKANIYVGGARTFGPQPRDYSFSLNKKVKSLARKSVFSSKVKENLVKVVEDFTYEAPKTKQFVKFLDSFSLTNKKSILVLDGLNPNVVLSGRNIPNTKVVNTNSVNTYDLVNAEIVLLSVSAVAALNER
ncbi:MAG: 50S ribosomal protein L4 [Cytophagales bacterium]|nr:MAG: 50S ribosomal protein L4 [Cytophagales bacterium]